MGSDLQSLTELRARPGLPGNRAVFTESERAHCERRPDPLASYGGLLCAKEACFKALSDFADRPPLTFLDLQIGHDAAGRPHLAPRGRLLHWLRATQLCLDVTISHSADYATATVVAVRLHGPRPTP